MRGTSNYNIIAKPGSIDAYKERQKGYNNIEFNAELVDAQGVYTTGTAENIVGPAEKDEESQNKGIIVVINMLWDQFNVSKDAANPNILKNQNIGE